MGVCPSPSFNFVSLTACPSNKSSKRMFRTSACLPAAATAALWGLLAQKLQTTAAALLPGAQQFCKAATARGENDLFGLQHARMPLDQHRRRLQSCMWSKQGSQLEAGTCLLQHALANDCSQPTCMAPNPSGIVHHNEAEGEGHGEQSAGHAKFHCNGCGHGLQWRGWFAS